MRGWLDAMRLRGLDPADLHGFGRLADPQPSVRRGTVRGSSLQTSTSTWREWTAIARRHLLRRLLVVPDDDNRRASSGVWTYAAQVGRMREITDDTKPVWVTVETTSQIAGEPIPTTCTRRSGPALIAGARGVILFDHRFGIDFVTTGLRCDAQRRPDEGDGHRPRRARLQTLGPALHAADLGLVTAWTSSNTTAGSDGRHLRRAHPLHDPRATGPTSTCSPRRSAPAPRRGTLTIPSWAGETVDVIDEARTVTVSSAGVLTDTFAADYTTHLYQRD